MASRTGMSADEHVKRVPAGRRPAIEAARRTVRAAAPKAQEIACSPEPPRSASYMWKILRYRVDGADVAGIGTFANHSALFFYRGRELDDGSGLLEGAGKAMRFIRLVEPADAERPQVRRLVKRAFELGGEPGQAARRPGPAKSARS